MGRFGDWDQSRASELSAIVAGMGGACAAVDEENVAGSAIAHSRIADAANEVVGPSDHSRIGERVDGRMLLGWETATGGEDRNHRTMLVDAPAALR